MLLIPKSCLKDPIPAKVWKGLGVPTAVRHASCEDRGFEVDRIDPLLSEQGELLMIVPGRPHVLYMVHVAL